uniref:(northern house mosquito) hypothetical protein n=1 Tax=Culex pipiens TaxID=7175 RepID=A0A8D8PBI5_CULPI
MSVLKLFLNFSNYNKLFKHKLQLFHSHFGNSLRQCSRKRAYTVSALFYPRHKPQALASARVQNASALNKWQAVSKLKTNIKTVTVKPLRNERTKTLLSRDI